MTSNKRSLFLLLMTLLFILPLLVQADDPVLPLAIVNGDTITTADHTVRVIFAPPLPADSIRIVVPRGNHHLVTGEQIHDVMINEVAVFEVVMETIDREYDDDGRVFAIGYDFRLLVMAIGAGFGRPVDRCRRHEFGNTRKPIVPELPEGFGVEKMPHEHENYDGQDDQQHRSDDVLCMFHSQLLCEFLLRQQPSNEPASRSRLRGPGLNPRTLAR